MSKSINAFLGFTIISAAFILGAPFLAFAAFEDVVIPKPDVIVLSLSAVKPGTLQAVSGVVAKDTQVEIRWQSDAKNGCYANFKSGKLDATGSVTGPLEKTRSFVITCYGNGSSKTAKGQLVVGNPRLDVSGAGIQSGLIQKFNSTGGKLVNTYIGGGKLLFQGTIRNSGNLDLTDDITVRFDGNGTTMKTQTIKGLPAGKNQVITYEHQTGSDGIEYQFKFCAKIGTQADKCSTIPGKYKFVVQ